MDPNKAFDARIAQIHGLSAPDDSGVAAAGLVDTRQAELLAMIAVFLGENYDPIKISDIETMQAELVTRQGRLVEQLQRGEISPTEYLASFNETAYEIFGKMEQILGKADFLKLFGPLPDPSVGFVDREMFKRAHRELVSEESGQPLMVEASSKEIATDDELHAFLTEIRQGSEAAAWRLIELYGPHIQRVVRRHLDRRLRSKFDSIDFVQAVWASFFRNPAKIQDFRTRDELVGYLAAQARYKVYDEVRRRIGSAKSNVARERKIRKASAVPDSAPTPEEIAAARDVWNRLVEAQTPSHQEIVRLRFAGATYQEIAQKLAISESTARRFIDRLLRLESLRAG